MVAHLSVQVLVFMFRYFFYNGTNSKNKDTAMQCYKILLLSVLCGVLFGCVSVPQAPMPVNNPVQTWALQQPKLAQITHWKVSGLVGVVLNQQAQSANVIWQQKTDDHYTIEFYGPLGLGATYLQGKPGQVTLTTHEGKKYSAANAQQLMNQALGWSLPIEGLVYWIRGLPVAYVPYQSTFNQYGTLASLTQQGWRIQYLSEQVVNGTILPTKIRLKNKDLQVTIVIHQWQL